MRGKKVGIIGAGRIGEAILRGLIDSGLISRENIIASDIREEKLKKLPDVVKTDNKELARTADVIIIAVKPPDVMKVLAEIESFLDEDEKLLISVAAGIRTEYIENIGNKKLRVIRAMPNIACLVRESVTVLCRGRYASKEDENTAKEIFESVGSVITIEDEDEMDVVTGLSGSGIAFIATLIDALSDGALHEGLPRELSTELSARVTAGAAKMILSGMKPSDIREMTASPGGTTIRGLYALERGCTRSTVMEAVIEATKRSRELSSYLRVHKASR